MVPGTERCPESFEESTKLLDDLIAKLDNPSEEMAYSVGYPKSFPRMN